MSKKLSVMVAFVCQPYVAALFRRSYEKYWRDEVDEVLVNVNGRNSKIRKLIVDMWKNDDKVVFIDDVDWEMRQGRAFDNLYKKVTGQILMTVDSDNFIYKKGVVSKFRDMMLNKQYDAIGSRGLHAYPKRVMSDAVSRYGIVRLNPFLSFWRKDVIDKIEDLTFGTFNYKEGDKFQPLDKMSEGGWMDVMSKFSLDYFYFAKRYLLIPGTQAGEYVHLSGISSIYRRKFKSLEDNDSQKFIETALHPWHNVNYWMQYELLYEETKGEVPEWYNVEYKKGLDLEINKAEMTREKIEEMKSSFKAQHRGLFGL